MLIAFIIFYSVLVLGLCALVVLAAKKMIQAFHNLQIRAIEATQKLQAEKAAMHQWQVGFEQKLKTERANLQETIRALEEKVKNRSIDLEKAIATTQVLKARLHAKELEVAELKSKKKRA